MTGVSRSEYGVFLHEQDSCRRSVSDGEMGALIAAHDPQWHKVQILFPS